MDIAVRFGAYAINQSIFDEYRRNLSDNQRSVLEQWCARDPYPTHDTIRSPSDVIGVSKRRVYTLFFIPSEENKARVETQYNAC